MTRTEQVVITGLGLWLPHYPDVPTWLAGEPDPAADKPRGMALDRMNRRRASLLGRAVADASAQAMARAEVDPATVPTVIGSSIAEAATMLGLLDQIWRQQEPASPAAFTVSVHNAASGLISISNKNRGFTTSLAADDDTPAAALLEGIGLLLTTGEPVVVACGDEAVPEHLLPSTTGWGLMAAAVVLAPQGAPGPRQARARVVRPGAPDLAPVDLGPSLGSNPQVGLFDLVDAVARGSYGTLRLDRGQGQGFCVELEPAG